MLKGHCARLQMQVLLRQARCRQCVVRRGAHLLQQAKQNTSAKAGGRKCLGVAGGDPQEERVDKAVCQREREETLRQVNRQEKESKAPKRPLDAQACRRKKIAGKLGWVVTRNTHPMPLTSWRAASCASLRQVPSGQYQFSTHKIATHAQR